MRYEKTKLKSVKILFYSKVKSVSVDGLRHSGYQLSEARGDVVTATSTEIARSSNETLRHNYARVSRVIETTKKLLLNRLHQ